jgi:hypoxanthine phosphoribosyltransferase
MQGSRSSSPTRAAVDLNLKGSENLKDLSAPDGRADDLADGSAYDLDDWFDDPCVGEIVVDRFELRRRVAEIGRQITEDYAGVSLLLIGVLKGAFVFMSDLAREIDLPLEIDVMAISSYGSGTSSSGVIRIVKDLDADLTGRHVLVVEDIVDSGITLSYLRRNLLARHPESLEVCALLVKQGAAGAESSGASGAVPSGASGAVPSGASGAVPLIRYVGCRIPSAFVVGYGLDVAERYRNLPDVRLYDAGAD